MKRLNIFVRNPELGKTKTRLAAGIGDVAALAAYNELLSKTRDVCLGVNAQRAVHYSHFVDHSDQWEAENFGKLLQIKGDLGAKMLDAFKGGFISGVKRQLIIGSDCAVLKHELIEQAFEALVDHDFVIGPAEDGGYYLLGMSSYLPYVFEGKEWSTSSLFTETKKEIEEKGHSLFLLPELYDIDTIEDWNRWKKQ